MKWPSDIIYTNQAKDINVINQPQLRFSIVTGRESMVKQLNENGADLNTSDTLTISNNTSELIRNGADFNSVGRNGSTVWSWAALNGKKQ